MKFRQRTRTFSDETALYWVTEYKAGTVGEFVDEVLKECPRDWGYIETPEGRCEYRYGKLLTVLPEEALGLRIDREKGIEGYGGWSRMDYLMRTI